MEKDRADERFQQVDRRFGRLETSITALGAELRAEIRESTAQLREEIQASNAQLREEIRASNSELRTEIRHATTELRTEIQVVQTRTDAMQRMLLQIGGGLIGTMILAFSGLIATQI